MTDAFVIIFILISFRIGIARKGWRALWRLIFSALLLLGLTIFALKPLATWLASDDFFTLINFQPEIDLGTGEPIIITSITHLIYILGRLSTNRDKFTLAYSTQLALGISKGISLFAMILVVNFVSWIISAPLWFLVRRVIPKHKRLNKPRRLLGGLLGMVQGIMFMVFYMIATSSFAPGLTYLYESGQASWFGISDSIAGLVSILDPAHSTVFNFFSIDGRVLQFKVEGEEEVYFVGREFVDLGESLISGDLDSETIDTIIQEFNDECFNNDEFVCTI